MTLEQVDEEGRPNSARRSSRTVAAPKVDFGGTTSSEASFVKTAVALDTPFTASEVLKAVGKPGFLQ